MKYPPPPARKLLEYVNERSRLQQIKKIFTKNVLKRCAYTKIYLKKTLTMNSITYQLHTHTDPE